MGAACAGDPDAPSAAPRSPPLDLHPARQPGDHQVQRQFDDHPGRVSSAPPTILMKARTSVLAFIYSARIHPAWRLPTIALHLLHRTQVVDLLEPLSPQASNCSLAAHPAHAVQQERPVARIRQPIDHAGQRNVA